MNKVYLHFLITVLIFLVGCSDDCDVQPSEPIITSEELIFEGDDLILAARGNEDNEYSWTGPNGFTGSGRVVDLGLANAGKSGTYRVTVTKESCTSVSSSKEINVIIAEPACQPPINEIDFDKYPTIKGNAPICEFDSSRERFTVNLNAFEGSIYVVFPTGVPPAFDGTYTAIGRAETPSSQQVIVEAFTGVQPDIVQYFGVNGEVYVRRNGDNIEIIFCDLLFTRDDDVTIATGRIVCSL